MNLRNIRSSTCLKRLAEFFGGKKNHIYYDLVYHVTKRQFCHLKMEISELYEKSKQKKVLKQNMSRYFHDDTMWITKFFSFLCMSASSSRDNSFLIPMMRSRWSRKRSSTLSQPFEHINVAPTLHMLSSSLCHAALHWLRSMNYSSSPPSPPRAPFSSVVTELCYMMFAPSSDFCNMWWETV